MTLLVSPHRLDSIGQKLSGGTVKGEKWRNREFEWKSVGFGLGF